MGDLVLLGGVDLDTEDADVDDVGRGRRRTAGEAGAELEGEGVEVPGEGPVAGDGIASGVEGEMVVHDDASLLHRTGGEGAAGDGGWFVGEGVGEDAGERHDAREAGGRRRGSG